MDGLDSRTKLYYMLNTDFNMFNLFFFLLKNHNKIFYGISALLYALAIFLFEIVITFPFIISSFALIQNFFSKYIGYHLIKFSSYLKKTIIFWGIAFGFLLFRIILFPIKESPSCFFNFQNIWNIIKKRWYPDTATFLAELFNFSFIPGNNQLLKGSILIICLSFFGWLFYKNRHKKTIFLLITCGILSMWPAIKIKYMSRYTYFALPFFILTLLILINSYNYKPTPLQKKPISMLKITCLSILIFNIFFSFQRLKIREHETHHLFLKYEELAANPKIQNRILCFIGLPMHFVSGLAQAIWIRNINTHLPIYYEIATFTEGTTKTAGLSIKPTQDGFKMTSLDKENLSIVYPWIPIRMGETIINDAKPEVYKVYDLTFILDPKYKGQNLLFITWDYKNAKFKIL